MDTAIYNSRAEAIGNEEEEEKSGSSEWGPSHTLVSTATMSLN